MINELISGISIKLNQEFGDGFTIYTDSVEQGLQEPCFFIFVMKIEQTQVVGKRYFRQQPFDIHYFPSNTHNNAEILDVIERVQDCLEYVQVGSDLIRGTKMNFETVSGVLHCFINYNLYVIKQGDAEDDMETLTIGSGTKG